MPDSYDNNSTVTVTDNDAVIWSGPFHKFFVANSDGMDTGKWRILLDDGEVFVGGGAAPLLRVAIAMAEAR